MFKRISGSQNIEYYPKKASEDIENGALVQFDGSGYVTHADASSTGHVGIILRECKNDDIHDDYSENSKVPVDIPTLRDVLEVDVETGDCTDSDIGKQVDLESDGAGINVDSTSVGQVTIVGRVSSSIAHVKLNDSVFHQDKS